MVSVSDKARYLIKNNRVEITHLAYHTFQGNVVSEHGTYTVEILRDGRFNCGCDNFSYTDSNVECSHVLALKMHPKYRDWWPLKMTSDPQVLEFDLSLKSRIPLFNLEPRELQPVHFRTGRIIDPDKARAFAEEGDNITKFIRKLRFVDNKTYGEIREEIKKQFGLEVSQGYVYRRITNNPDYILTTGDEE